MNSKRCLLYTVLITVTYYTLLVSFLDFRFWEGDDQAYELFASGLANSLDFNYFPIFFGNYFEVLFFNYLKILYSYEPNFSWFMAIAQSACAMVFSFCVFFILKQKKEPLLKLSYITFLITFFVSFVTKISFTVIPMIIAFPITILIGTKTRKTWPKIILILVLYILALSIRGASFFVPYALLVFYLFLKSINNRKQLFPNTTKYLLLIFIPLSIYLIKPNIDNQIINRETYKNFMLIGEQGRIYKDYNSTELTKILNKSGASLFELELLRNQIIFNQKTFSKKVNKINQAMNKVENLNFLNKLKRVHKEFFKKNNNTLALIIILSFSLLLFQKRYMFTLLFTASFYLSIILLFSIKTPGQYFVYPYLFIFTAVLFFETQFNSKLKDKQLINILSIIIIAICGRYQIMNLLPKKLNKSTQFKNEIKLLKVIPGTIQIIDEDVFNSLYFGLKRAPIKPKLITRGWRELGKNSVTFSVTNNLSQDMCENFLKNNVKLISNDYYAYLYTLLCQFREKSLCFKKDKRFTQFNYWNLVPFTTSCHNKIISNGSRVIKKSMPYFTKVFNSEMEIKPLR